MTTIRLRPDLEDALRALPDVQAVSVVTSASGVPTEVHVLASPGKSAKQVVRDVQSMAMAAFEIDIDRRIVSVVQIGAQSSGPGSALVAAPAHEVGGVGDRGDVGDGGDVDDLNEVDELDAMADSATNIIRPVVQRISMSATRTGSSATVVVRMGSDEFTGEVSGAANSASRPRVVAEASVQAVGELLGAGCEVESAQVLHAGSHELAVVVLSLQVPRVGEQLLTGSALVRTYPDDAVVRAVLDALNRHLTG